MTTPAPHTLAQSGGTQVPPAEFRLRVQDFLLVTMFGALIVVAHTPLERGSLATLAALQLIEGRVAWLGTRTGRLASVVLQLLICYLLIGWTLTLDSEYYPVLLLPVMSTATYWGFSGTVLMAGAAIGAYLSFLHPFFVDWTQFSINWDSHAGGPVSFAGALSSDGEFTRRSAADGIGALQEGRGAIGHRQPESSRSGVGDAPDGAAGGAGAVVRGPCA
jgi:hypothetical protein